MAKKLKLLNDFSGGLVDAMHSRDIPDDSASVAVNVNLTADGTVIPIGTPNMIMNLSDDFFFEMEALDFRGAHNIHH